MGILRKVAIGFGIFVAAIVGLGLIGVALVVMEQDTFEPAGDGKFILPVETNPQKFGYLNYPTDCQESYTPCDP